ncbi:MAG TPA: MXAN_5187 C-terminal domain-containing protein [Polyangiaceae bacterium]|nr:MXAN_5187 C-terminal domain-containing protein [Polyangiaceae bacterium]
MESHEVDLAIEELEVRLERLRALYEQYFLGIEKIEPLVARKDVDRRLHALRREKIRNTAKRFKLQTIIQRYNTFQQYWQRICREIENGTYKRHLLRAERSQGPADLKTIAARRRFGRERVESAAPPPPEPQAHPSVAAASPGAAPPPPPAPGKGEGLPRRPPPPPKRRPAGPQPNPAAASAPSGPIEAKGVRELHARLVAASRAANRPAVSLETVEKTVKATEAALRAKHANRRIFFDVVVKDGKPALKPIVR